jgi:hypothetical protein
MSQHSATDPGWTGQVLEFIGLAFMLVPPGLLGEAFLKGETINWQLMIAIFAGYWTVGAFILLVGKKWPKWKPSNEAIANVIETGTRNIWVWLAGLVIFAFGPVLLVASFSQPAGFGRTSDQGTMKQQLEDVTRERDGLVVQIARPPLFRQRMGPVSVYNAITEAHSIWSTLAASHTGLLITFAQENGGMSSDLFNILNLGRTGFNETFLTMEAPNRQQNLDAPILQSSERSGIVLHADEQTQRTMKTFLERCFTVQYTTRIPDGLASYYKVPSIAWIEIGKGNPWPGTSVCTG